jgi:hypothetical protein
MTDFKWNRNGAWSGHKSFAYDLIYELMVAKYE